MAKIIIDILDGNPNVTDYDDEPEEGATLEERVERDGRDLIEQTGNDPEKFGFTFLRTPADADDDEDADGNGDAREDGDEDAEGQEADGQGLTEDVKQALDGLGDDDYPVAVFIKERKAGTKGARL